MGDPQGFVPPGDAGFLATRFVIGYVLGCWVGGLDMVWGKVKVWSTRCWVIFPKRLWTWSLTRSWTRLRELTTGELQARLARLVLEADPDGSQSSSEEGSAHANPDHTASLRLSAAS